MPKLQDRQIDADSSSDEEDLQFQVNLKTLSSKDGLYGVDAPPGLQERREYDSSDDDKDTQLPLDFATLYCARGSTRIQTDKFDLLKTSDV